MKRLILFDIDGTILHTAGTAKRAFHRALLEIYGTAGPISTHPFDGKTDPQIARELLRAAGLSDAIIDQGLDALWRSYLRGLASELAHPEHGTVLLPGVVELIEALEVDESAAPLGLLTGNVAQGAHLKLAAVGLAERFHFGAYGSDHERRDQLPAVAVQRAWEQTGREFRGEEVVIIGDTPFDVTCGRALGVRAVAVATGKYTANDLAAAGAEVVLSDLSDTAAALEAILAA